MIADTLNHGSSAGIADREALTGNAVQVSFA
jgi:hypothetical protein